MIPVKLMGVRYVLLTELVRRNILGRFRHSLLGVFWLFLPPLCILMLYVFVFSIIFQMRWPEREISSRWSFGLVIFCGMTVFAVFNESAVGSIASVSGNPNFVKRVMFPVELLPVSQAFASFLVNGMILLLILAVSLCSGGTADWAGIALLPVILVPLLLLSLGAAWFTAALGVFHRDISHVVGIVMMVLFFTAPVFYSARMVPAQYEFILNLNPLTPLVDNIRRVLLFGQLPDWAGVARSWLVGLLAFQFGYFCFAKWRKGFADVL